MKKTKKKKKSRAASIKLADHHVLSVAPEVLSRDGDAGKVTVLRLDNDRFFYKIDGVAADFWRRINGQLSIGTIKGELLERSGASEKEFNRHLSRFLRDLQKERLIEI